MDMDAAFRCGAMHERKIPVSGRCLHLTMAGTAARFMDVCVTLDMPVHSALSVRVLQYPQHHFMSAYRCYDLDQDYAQLAMTRSLAQFGIQMAFSAMSAKSYHAKRQYVAVSVVSSQLLHCILTW